MDELWGEFLVVVMQCLLLLTDPSQLDYSCLIIRGGRWGGWGGGGGGGGGGEGGGELVCGINMQYTPCSWGAVDTRCLAGRVNCTIDLQL